MFLNSSHKNRVNHNCTPTHNCKVVSLKVPFWVYLPDVLQHPPNIPLKNTSVFQCFIYTYTHSELNFSTQISFTQKGFHWIQNTLSPRLKFAYRITRIILFSFPPFNQFPTYKPLYLSFLHLFNLDINIYSWPLSLKCISLQYAFLNCQKHSSLTIWRAN